MAEKTTKATTHLKNETISAKLALLKSQAVVREGLFPLFAATQVIETVGLMKAAHVRPLGLDAIAITSERNQPFLEHSLDLSSNLDDPWGRAVQFLGKYVSASIWFEIIPEIESWFD